MKTKTIGKVTVTSNREFTMLTPDRRSYVEALREEEHRYKKKIHYELKQLNRLFHEARARVQDVSRAIQMEKSRIQVFRDRITDYLNKKQIPEKYRTRIMDKLMKAEKMRLRSLESMLYRYNDVLNNFKRRRYEMHERLFKEHQQNIHRIKEMYERLAREAHMQKRIAMMSR